MAPGRAIRIGGRTRDETLMENVISCFLTERSNELLDITLRWAECVLVNRKTGEFLRSSNARSGPHAITLLNGVNVICWSYAFTGWPASTPLEDLELVVIRPAQNETIKRNLDVDPLPFVVATSP